LLTETEGEKGMSRRAWIEGMLVAWRPDYTVRQLDALERSYTRTTRVREWDEDVCSSAFMFALYGWCSGDIHLIKHVENDAIRIQDLGFEYRYLRAIAEMTGRTTDQVHAFADYHGLWTEHRDPYDVWDAITPQMAGAIVQLASPIRQSDGTNRWADGAWGLNFKEVAARDLVA
jgi:hypothetical protein